MLEDFARGDVRECHECRCRPHAEKGEQVIAGDEGVGISVGEQATPEGGAERDAERDEHRDAHAQRERGERPQSHRREHD